MLKSALIVGLGGFLGGAIRFLSTNLIHKYFVTNYPLGTMIINIIGCLLIGFFLGIFEKGHIISANLRLFLTVGFCGGFTTFSTFSHDTINLLNEAQIFLVMTYIGLSIFIGIIFTYVGKYLSNFILS